MSHRSLFQHIFDSLSGVIVHLANKDFEGDDDGFWFAGQIMDWSSDDALVFLPDTRRDIADLMQRLLAASPRHEVVFSTDYQFGGDMREHRLISVSEFFDLHDRFMLRYNHLWRIRPNV